MPVSFTICAVRGFFGFLGIEVVWKSRSGLKTEIRAFFVWTKYYICSNLIIESDLKIITRAVNNLSPNRKISEAMVIRVLITGGRKMKPEKLPDLIREDDF